MKRYPVYTVFENQHETSDSIEERPIQTYASEEEAEKSIQDGDHDEWLSDTEPAHLYVQKTWTKEVYIPYDVLEKVKNEITK